MSEPTGVLPDTNARDLMMQIALGYMGSQALHVACRLGVMDHLAHGPKSAADIGPVVDADPPTLHRLLRALTAMGMLAEPEPGRFEATPFGALMRSDVEGSVASSVRLFVSAPSWMSWGALEHSVRTGDCAYRHLTGKPTFEMFDDDAELSAVFNEAMAEGTRRVAPMLPEVYDFSHFETIADLGGSNGTLLAAVLGATPELRGVNFDLAPAMVDAPGVFEAAGLTDRCDIVVGDFFAEVPEGPDAFIMKSVIHDWNDDECVEILANCARVLPEGGRVFVLEPILPERITSMDFLGTLMSDLNMLCVTTGRERTEAEFRSLFERAGLDMVGIHGPVGAFHMQLMEGARAD